MKKVVVLMLIVSLTFLMYGCQQKKYADVTPDLTAIESVSFQRTNIDENNQYTYYEKAISDAKEIEHFCKKLDKVHFVRIDPVEFTSVDYLIVFEGKLDHKLMISGNEIIYDGLAYQLEKGDLKDFITDLYDELEQQEKLTDSKLFM